VATRSEITKTILSMRFLPNSPIKDGNVEAVVETFEQVLSDLPNDVVVAAARQYLSTATFFPSPGALRESAIDLQMLAIGIPTPAEAWGMVLGAVQYREMALCADGTALRNGLEGKTNYEYWVAQSLYTAHLNDCKICDEGGYKEIYRHPAVANTVILLGGRETLLTNNPVSDRARFIEAYRDVVARERMRAGMVPEVQEYVRKHALEAGKAPKQIQDVIGAMKGAK
jgi:hypothetical protein